MWKEWFSFSKSEHRAVWILLVLIALSLAVRYVRVRERDLQEQIDSLTAVAARLPEPSIAVTEPDTPRPRPLVKRPPVYPTPSIATVDSLKPEPEPIGQEIRPGSKLKTLTPVDLNQADSTLLQQIPGIGPAYARAIVNYRNRLGGYLRVEQLRELTLLREGAFEQISPWFRLDSVVVKQININKASFKELVRHPYIGFERAKVISNFIRKSGSLSSLQQLSLLEGFGAEEIKRLEPYVRME